MSSKFNKFMVVSWILSLLLCWFITKNSVKPETVIVNQDRIIYRLKKDIEAKEKIEKSERFLWVFKKGELLWGITGLAFGKIF